jgi:acyl-homoserine lactone synthase
MIEVVTSRNALLYRDALDAMYRLRHRALVEVQGLEKLRRADGMVRDRFDTDDAIYLLLSDDDGTVRGALRLLPTTGPHVLSDVVPELCDFRGVQRDAKTLELSRLCIDPGLDRVRAEVGRNRLLVGLFEFCRRAGYDRLTLLIHTDNLYRHLLIGLDIKPLGLGVDRDGLQQIPVVVRVNDDALASLRDAFNVHDSEIYYVGAPRQDVLVLGPAPSWPRAAAPNAASA